MPGDYRPAVLAAGFPARRTTLRRRCVGTGRAGCGISRYGRAHGGSRRSHADRLRHAPDSGPGYPGRRPLRGDQLRLAVASRVVLWRQADHPALRRVADRRWAGDRQQLPIRQAGRNSTVGLHSRVRRRRRRRSDSLARCIPRRVAARVHRSSSASTTTSTATPGTPSRCRGFAGSIRCSACSAPASTGVSTCASGPAPMELSGIRARPATAWAWQTRSWSRGQIDPAAVLYQRVVSTASNPGPIVGGIEVDVNDVLAQDCGQWNLHP